MMSGQHRAGEIIEPNPARLAPITLAMWLGVGMAIPDYFRTATACTANTIGPAILANGFKALAVIK
jgi:hypothetical protein